MKYIIYGMTNKGHTMYWHEYTWGITPENATEYDPSEIEAAMEKVRSKTGGMDINYTISVLRRQSLDNLDRT